MSARLEAKNPAIVSRTTSRPVKAESGRMTAAQRNTFRMMLATGATLAALIGAQAMAVLDRTSTAIPTQSQSSQSANSGTSSNNSSDANGYYGSNGFYYYSDNGSQSSSSSAYTYSSSQAQPRPRTRSS